MGLKNDKRQNIQLELDFSSARSGEAREAGRGRDRIACGDEWNRKPS